MSSDNVNRPAHYTAGKVECIEALEAMLGSYNFQSLLRGQVVKYMWRMDKKGTPLEDARKAQFYLNKLVAVMEEELKDGSAG